MKKIRAVLGFEYLGYIKSKSFIVTTIIFVAVILILSTIPRFMGAFDDLGSLVGGGEGSPALVVVGGEAEQGGFAKALDPAALSATTGGSYVWTVRGQSEQSDAEPGVDPQKLISEGTYDVVVVYDGGENYDVYGKGQDFAVLTLPAMLDPVFTDAARSLKMKAMPADVRSDVESVIGTTVAGEVTTVGGGSAENNFWLAYVMLYVLFMSIMMYGQFIVNAVINEKSSKMMELLVTSARPIELMFGKVFGVGLAAFTQLGSILAAAGAAIAINYGMWMNQIPGFGDMISRMNISAGLFVFFVLFFVIGYFLYAFICAAVGSTASRVEDAGSVSTLPMMLATGAFIVSMISMSNIEATYVEVLSFIPFFTPWIMFARLCMASATFGDAAIALAILIASVICVGWLAAKIYRVGVMMYGKPMKLGAALKMAFRP
jgi:ABC-2 type transport system permease protein